MSTVGEGFVGFQAREEVVVAALFFDDRCGGLAVLADFFVEGLAVAAGGDCGHEDVFGGHEGELFAEGAGDDVGVDDQAAGHVLVEDQNRVDGEEGLRDREAAVGGVVERALHPLRGVGFVGVRGEAHGEAGEAADAFGAHGVALVGHRGGADLVGFEGLFDFFAVGEDAEIGRGFVAARGDAGEGVEDLGVDLARVGLAGDGVGAGEAHLFGDALLRAGGLWRGRRRRARGSWPGCRWCL